MKRREKRKRNRKGNNGVPSYDKHPRTHQEKKRKVPSMTEAPRDTQARIKGEEERERERWKKRRGYEASVQGHTRERGVPECCIQEQRRRQSAVPKWLAALTALVT